MLTFEDCLGVCELTEEEVDAIAEHEHLPEMLALEMGAYLMRGPDGQILVEHMIVDDIRAAQARRDFLHAARLKNTLRHFLETHRARANETPPG